MYQVPSWPGKNDAQAAYPGGRPDRYTTCDVKSTASTAGSAANRPLVHTASSQNAPTARAPHNQQPRFLIFIASDPSTVDGFADILVGRRPAGAGPKMAATSLQTPTAQPRIHHNIPNRQAITPTMIHQGLRGGGESSAEMYCSQ